VQDIDGEQYSGSSGVRRYSTTAGMRLTVVTTQRQSSNPGPPNPFETQESSADLAVIQTPGSGGIAKRRSSRMRDRSPSRSLRSWASTHAFTVARSSSDNSCVAGVRQSSRRSGSCSRIVTRARCRALVTDATLSPSASAVVAAGQPRTSRRISAARWRGGRCWTATMNASSIVSRATADSCGSSGSIRSG
jgi:hypothetical protein